MWKTKKRYCLFYFYKFRLFIHVHSLINYWSNFCLFCKSLCKKNAITYEMSFVLSYKRPIQDSVKTSFTNNKKFIEIVIKYKKKLVFSNRHKKIVKQFQIDFYFFLSVLLNDL